MSLPLERLDYAFRRSAQRVAAAAGYLRLTPYQVGMAWVVLPMLPCLAVLPLFLMAVETCARLACQGPAAAAVAHSWATVALMAFNPVSGMVACVASLRLCARRQREWRHSVEGGMLMPAPRLLSDAIWGPHAWFTRPVMSCGLLAIEVMALACVTTQTGAPVSYGAMQQPMGRFVCCLTLAITMPYCHALVTDYLLLATPRIRPRRRHARVPLSDSLGTV